jgi:hypothetical protein
MASTFFFGGQTYSTPTTVSQVNDSGFGPNTLGAGNNLVIVGPSTGGQPNMELEFGSPDEAASVLLSGELLTAVRKAFAPSTETGGPGKISAIVVGQATQSALSLLSASAVPVIALVSTQYGLPANQTKIMVSAGSNSTLAAPSVKVSMAMAAGAPMTLDNIYQAAFSVNYTGAAASAQVQVTNTAVTLFAPAGTAVATITLTPYMTLDQVVDQINGVPGFSAQLGIGATGMFALNSLDFLAVAQNCKASPYIVTATTQAVATWINSQACGLAVATLPTTGASRQPPAPIGWTFLTGATNPAPVVGDWTTALNALQTVNCQHVAVLSANPAVWAAADAHVQFMSTVGRKERRAYVGGALGDSLATVEGYPMAINSDRTAICYPGYKDYDASGNLVTFASYQTAALVAACFAGLNPGDAMTNKTVNVLGLEAVLRNPTDTDPLIQSGVLCLEATDQGYKVVRSISSWLTNDNFNRVEISCGIATDFAISSVRNAVDANRGGRQGPLLMGLALSIAESTLNDLSKPLPLGPGVLVGDAESPPWKNLTASIKGDDLLISFQMSPVIPDNFIGVTASLAAYSGTASA